MTRSRSGSSSAGAGGLLARAVVLAACLPAVWALSAGRQVHLVPDRAAGIVVVKAGRGGAAGEVLRIAAVLTGGATADRIVSWKPAPASGGGERFGAKFAAGAKTAEVTFSVSPRGTVTVAGDAVLAGVSVRARLRYGIVPSRRVCQTIYPADSYKPGATLHLPAESIVAGLVAGGNRMIVLVWPPGEQQVRLVRGPDGDTPTFEAAEVTLAGGELHIGAFDATGIWHRVTLTGELMEKHTPLKWKRPFAAKWVTQLKQNDVPTTFIFEGKARRRWWPGTGQFQYPVWFEGDRAMLHVGKKIPPEGEAVIFPLAGGASTPFDFLRAVLPASERRKITELAPTKSVYSLAGKRAPYVWPRHCDGHRAMRTTILVVGAHFREREFMYRHIEERVQEDVAVALQGQRYRDFVTDMSGRFDRWTAAEKGNPPALSFLKEMRKPLAELETKLDGMMAGRTPAEYAGDIRAAAEKFKRAVAQDGRERLAEMRILLKTLNEPKSRIEKFGSVLGSGARGWHVRAGQACVADARAAAYAVRIRQAVRELLEYRAYEVHPRYWPDMR